MPITKTLALLTLLEILEVRHKFRSFIPNFGTDFWNKKFVNTSRHPPVSNRLQFENALPSCFLSPPPSPPGHTRSVLQLPSIKKHCSAHHALSMFHSFHDGMRTRPLPYLQSPFPASELSNTIVSNRFSPTAQCGRLRRFTSNPPERLLNSYARF